MLRLPTPRCSWVLMVLAAWLIAPSSRAAIPAGYRTFAEFEAEARRLAERPCVRLSKIATTAGGRGVWVLKVSAAAAPSPPRPAVLVVGSADAGSLVGSYVAMAMVEEIARKAAAGEAPCDAVDFYFIPRPAPEASERLFDRPAAGGGANLRPTDDDRDGLVDEDPPEDLNGDGRITSMRVAEEGGEYRPHPDDPRVMIKADPKRGEAGGYRLLSEGVDNDGDQQWNEDPVGGVAFDRNFTFRYPYFKPGAGPHQVSEPETRGVADFCFDHRNVFLVFTFSAVDNLNHPWKPKRGEGRIKRAVQPGDSDYLSRLAAHYKRQSKPRGVPPAENRPGGFAEWAYFHYGRWSLAGRGWWVPDARAKEKNAASRGGASGSPETGDAEATVEGADEQPAEKQAGKKPDPRGERQQRLLRWLEGRGLSGFVAWTPVDHPDFPGKRVEVGGMEGWVAANPPPDVLDAAPLTGLLLHAAGERAVIGFASATAERLGGGVVRITAEVANRGRLPTLPAMGRIAGKHQRLEVELRGPAGMRVLSGPLRQDLDVLQPGQVAERRWLVRLPAGQGIDALSLKAGEPSVGFSEHSAW